MAPATRPDGKLNLNLSGLSPNLDQPPPTSTTSPFNGSKLLSGGMSSMGNSRHGAGSPLLEQSSRLFPRRTRELQGQTTLSPSIWGPPTSGTSTPLMDIITESPSQESGFPDLVPVTEAAVSSPARRARAGTLPSRISPVGTANGHSLSQFASKTSRPTPSTSPFKPTTSTPVDSSSYTSATSGSAALLSRLRAGSLPQRASFFASSSPFGQSVFASNWTTRDRENTLSSIKSSEELASPTFSREGMTDNGVRTLDYLGLAETPQQSKATPFRPINGTLQPQDQANLMSDLMANLDLRNSNRFRSFSVNTARKFPEERDDEYGANYVPYQSGAMTPSAAAALEAEYEAVQEKVRLHNQAVQDFAKNASAARPRARTAGIIETPQRTTLRNIMQAPSPIMNNLSNGQVGGTVNDRNLPESFQSLTMNGEMTAGQTETFPEEEGQASRSLWIGSIPISTTNSSLDAIFARFGTLESTRVLTHKNCGFVNFENIENAVRARSLLNGKEIFPGAGPVRIGFAKAPNASNSATPAYTTLPPSPTRDAFEATKPQDNPASTGSGVSLSPAGTSPEHGQVTNRAAELSEQQPEILQMVLDFGALESDLPLISSSIQSAVNYPHLEREIPPVSEPTQTRMYDAPRLRDIRKRIDNGACGLQEIEQIANDMLPEIAELASDYLGNTVVQKLFEYCSEQTKEQMLSYIAPHLAEIGVHKNGTWAAQKIIEVCKTETQTRMIVDSLRPYTIPLFLDQYGNYVLQCCLRFGSPYNDFIFETMMCQMLEVAQGRFGARAMRACLEAHHASKHQQRTLAAVIALNCVQLASNTNGALLLTWFLDTCTFPHRRTVLAPRLVPQLVHLCTHKVAYLTVLKVINQRNEPEARDMILKALFSSGDTTLEQILSDQTSGATLIFKILTTPFFDEQLRNEVVRNVTSVLTRIKAQPNQGYKRLMDEVGLSSRPAHAPVHTQPNNSFHGNANQSRPMPQPLGPHYTQPQMPQRQYSGSYLPTLGMAGFENGQSPVRTGSADSFGYPNYPLNNYGAQAPFHPAPQMTPQQPIPYQNMVANSQRGNGSFMPNVAANAFAGYPTTGPSVDNFRGIQSHGSPHHNVAQMSPIMNSGLFSHPSYMPGMAGNMYGYQQQPFFPPPMQTVQGGARNRRR